MRPGLTLQQSLFDELARDIGFTDGTSLLSAPPRDNDDVKRVLQEMPAEDTGIQNLYNTPVLSVQNHLLDYYARKNGYATWRDLIDKKLYKERDYGFFSRILKVNTNRVKFEETEFTKLSEIVGYLRKISQPYTVFDTTDIRAEPGNQLQELCRTLGVSFSLEMINWDGKPVNFATQQLYPFMLLYQKKKNSKVS